MRRHQDSRWFGRSALALATLTLCCTAAAVQAQGREGKLALTGGVSSIDGAAGGGLTPWALIGSYASEGQFGASAFFTRLVTQDHSLNGYGVAASYGERIELSIAHQDFDTGRTGTALGLPGLHLKQNIVGAKLRVAGDAILDSDTLMPQVAVGVEYKKLDAGGLDSTLQTLGAKDSGTDFYVSATKLFLAQSVLANLTLRASKANQNGLLGFGGAEHRGYRVLPEISLAWLLSKQVAIGVEYRVKPDNLNPSALGKGLKESDWKDAFVAWAPSKNLSLTLAYVDLGRIVPAVANKRQRGAYLSAQIAY